MSYNATTRCIMCQNPGTIACKRCRDAKYCSTQCCKSDERVHQSICRQLSNLAPLPSTIDSSAVYCLGIYLPLDFVDPQFVWIRCTISPDGDMTPDVDALVSTPSPGWICRFSFDRNILQGGLKIPRALDIWYISPTYHGPDSQPSSQDLDGDKLDDLSQHSWEATDNKCIRNLNRGRSQAMSWHSSAVVMHVIDPTSEKKRYGDVQAADIRHVADFYAIHHQDGRCGRGLAVYSPEDHFDPPAPGEAYVQGVRIHGASAVDKLDREKYVPWNVSRQHAISRLQVHNISDLLGFPVIVMKFPPNFGLWELEVDGAESKGGENIEASALQASTCLTLKEWGVPNQTWAKDIGDVVAVRKDGKPLLVQHAEALAWYCMQRKDGPMKGLRDKMGWRDGIVRYDDIIARMSTINDSLNKSNFLEFWEEIKGMEGWKNIRGPYEV